MYGDTFQLIEPENQQEIRERQHNTIIDGLTSYLRQIRKPLLTHEETMALAVQYRDKRSEEARQLLISHNLRLVVHCVREIYKYGPHLDDLIQEGNIGLMHAVEKFDPEFGVRFTTYAYSWIRERVLLFLKGHTSIVRLPVGVVEKRKKLLGILNEHKKKGISPPTHAELSKLLGLSPLQMRGIICLGSQSIISLDTPIAMHEESGMTFGEKIPDLSTPDPFITSCARNELQKNIDLLQTFYWMIKNSPKMKERNKEILCDRLGFNPERRRMKLEELSNKYLVTAQAIQQTVTTILAGKRFKNAGISEKVVLELFEKIEILADMVHSPVYPCFD